MYASCLKYNQESGTCDCAGMSILEKFFKFFDPGAKAKAKGYKRNKSKAMQGDPWAMERVGKAFEFGQGVEQSYTKAVEWYQKAAEQGRASAQAKLGRMYENGRGVEQNLETALKWYTQAIENGHLQATANRDAVKLHIVDQQQQAQPQGPKAGPAA